MARHQWKTYEQHDPDFVGDEDVYMFAFTSGAVHNGPLCMTCGRTGCVHCERQMLIEECPGAARTDGSIPGLPNHRLDPESGDYVSAPLRHNDGPQ